MTSAVYAGIVNTVIADSAWNTGWRAAKFIGDLYHTSVDGYLQKYGGESQPEQLLERIACIVSLNTKIVSFFIHLSVTLVTARFLSFTPLAGDTAIKLLAASPLTLGFTSQAFWGYVGTKPFYAYCAGTIFWHYFEDDVRAEIYKLFNPVQNPAVQAPT